MELSEADFDVRSLLAPRIYSQGQLASIAKDPTSLRNELDALVEREKLIEIENERRSTIEEIKSLQANRLKLKEAQKEIPNKQTELQKLNDKILFIEQKWQKKDVLTLFEGFEKESIWISAVLKELDTQANLLNERATSLEQKSKKLDDLPTNTPSAEWLQQVYELFNEQISSTSQLIRNEANRIRELIKTIKAKVIIWHFNYSSAKQEYNELLREMKERGVGFDQYESLLQKRAQLENDLKNLHSIPQKLEQVQRKIEEQRNRLIQIHKKRQELRKNHATTLEKMDADVRIAIIPFGDRSDFERRREEWFSGTGLHEKDWSILVDYVFAQANSIPEKISKLVKALRNDIEVTNQLGRPLEPSESSVVKLLGQEKSALLSGHFFRALMQGNRIQIDHIERFLPEDYIEAQVRGPEGGFKPIVTGSIGQRSTAILSLLLSAGTDPLIIDQPEADLDNRYIYEVVVGLLRKRKFTRQIIVATHNANIPVNGDAELIVALNTENRMGKLLGTGSIDKPEMKEFVTAIMEGSAEAFRLRRERYGF